MKRSVIILFMVALATVFIAPITRAQSSDGLNIITLTKLWPKSPAIPNALDSSQRIISFGDNTLNMSGRIHNYRGQIICDNKYDEILMSTVEWPQGMEFQGTSMFMTVNDHNIKVTQDLSYQIYEFPKWIDGKIVIRSRVGMAHADYFFVVIEPNGSNYYTTARGAEVGLELND
jgi:hypothetical protein